MSEDLKRRSVVTSMKLRMAIVFTLTVFAALTPAVRSSGVIESDNEREFEDKVPKHLPIKMRIHPDHEKAAKDLSNDRWQNDIAFEIKNTGDKPIYYLSFFLEMPEIKPNGQVLGSPLSYGDNSILGKANGFARPEDVPIKPNDTIVLTLTKAHADGWYETSKIENLPQPNKVEIVFMELNFGDGTGFIGTTGTPWPRPKRASTR
jgi:hypothetical protein